MKAIILAFGFSLALPSAVLAGPLAVKEGKAKFIAKAVPGFLSIDSEEAPVEGELVKDGKKITGELRCKMDGFKISIGFRNTEMKEKYLKVAEFPTSTLKLTNFEVGADGLASDVPFKGTLKVRDTEKPIEGTASVTKDGDGFRVKAAMVVSTEEFGMGVPSHEGVHLKKDVNVEVELKLVEGAAAPAAAAPAATPAAAATPAVVPATPAEKPAVPAKDSGKAAPKKVEKK